MPPRRSESPEGVGDLLKQDSFGFEEEEPVQELPTADVGNGQEAPEVASKEDQSTSADAGAASGSGGGKQQQGAKAYSFKGKGPARYFIVKSNNHSNIEHSIKNGIWATQKHNEDKLVDAYRSASHVYIIFSVNMSGHFQGYSKMAGLPFRHQPGAWEGSAAVSNSFNVDWIRRFDLPFKETEQLTNPLNENKPVKISRDGQELPLSLGLQLCRLFDQGADAVGVPKPPRPVRDPAMRAGPAVSGGGRGAGRGGGMGMGQGPAGVMMPPMGMMPDAMAMGMGGPMMGMGFGPAMMGDMMGPMGMGGGAMGMGLHPMMGMGAMMGAGGMPGRGPVPPPKPPPPARPPPGARPPPLEPDYRSMANGSRSRMGSESGRTREEDLMLQAFKYAQRGRSPGRRDRRYSSRSRSASPRRGRSRRRSRSRSRSRGRGRDRDDLLEMSYDDYLEAFKALKKAKMEKEMAPAREREPPRGGSRDGPAGLNPMMSQMSGMMGGGGVPAGGGLQSMMSQMGGRTQVGQGMSEEEYVRVWENYSRMTGRPFDAQTVRGWYRQYQQMSN